MKKIIYSLCLLFSFFSLTSCDDEGQEPILTGKWNYTKPYFEFEYAQDSVTINMVNKKMSIGVDDLKTLFLAMAQEKMGDYFQGITFQENAQLIVHAQMKDEVSLPIHASYTQKDNLLVVVLDAEDMKNLAGEIAGMIPAISFKYVTTNNTLTLYLDQTYIHIIYASMESKIIPLIIQMMGIDFAQNPQLEQIIAAAVKDQIANIFENIRYLRIGFELEKVQ